MARNTIADKLNLLITTKSKIRTAINNAGVLMKATVPFSKYSDYINKIKDVSSMSSENELIGMCDIYEALDDNKYDNHIYTEKEIAEINNYINLILEGENINGK